MKVDIAEKHVVRNTVGGQRTNTIEPVTITFLFELIPLKCIYLHRGYFGLIKKKYQCARVQIAVAGIKTLNSLQIIKIGQRFLPVRQFCRAFLERNPIFFISFFFFFCTVIFFASAFAQCIYGTAGQTQCAKSYKRDQRSHLGKTIDALITGDNF